MVCGPCLARSLDLLGKCYLHIAVGNIRSTSPTDINFESQTKLVHASIARWFQRPQRNAIRREEFRGTMSRYSLHSAMVICLSNTLVTASCSILAYIVLKSGRQLFLHPLKRFPGPRLAALTLWYKAFYDILMDGGWSEHLDILHARYGEYISCCLC